LSAHILCKVHTSPIFSDIKTVFEPHANLEVEMPLVKPLMGLVIENYTYLAFNVNTRLIGECVSSLNHILRATPQVRLLMPLQPDP